MLVYTLGLGTSTNTSTSTMVKHVLEACLHGDTAYMLVYSLGLGTSTIVVYGTTWACVCVCVGVCTLARSSWRTLRLTFSARLHVKVIIPDSWLASPSISCRFGLG